jgi:hypothetical protein
LVPVRRVVVSSVATPLVSVPVPNVVEPLRKVTEPVGETDPVVVAVMVAVKVTLCPKTGALGENVSVVVVIAFPTVTVVTGEVLDVNVESPEYWAVIELAPIARAVGGSEATPSVSVAVPSEVVPLKNWTVPVGVPEVIAATVAVSVTSCPNTGALGVKETVVVEVGVGASVTVTAGEVSPLKLSSPRYCAVIELAPAARLGVVKVPTPLVSVAVPIVVAPLKNWTVPVGVPDPGLAALTVAVSVTFCPTTGNTGANVTTVDEADSPTVTVVADEVLGVKVLSPE